MNPNLSLCLTVASFLAFCPLSEQSAKAAANTSYIYVSTNPDGGNGVEAFSRDRKTGELARIGRFDTGGTGDPFTGGFEQHSIVSNGEHLYVVNPGSDTISVFDINADGSLDLIQQIGSGGRRPVSLAVNKKLLYVANEGNSPIDTNLIAGNYTGFLVNNDGSLTSLANSTVELNPGDSPADVVFSKNGKVLVGTRLPGNQIDSFSVESTGLLSHQQTIPGGGGPFGALFNPAKANQLVVTVAVPEFFPGELAPGAVAYNVGSDGTLTKTGSYTDPDLSDAGLRDPCWLAYAKGGKYFWTSSFIPRMLTLFALDSKGNITRVSEYNPHDTESVPNPEDPMGPNIDVVLGSTDIATDKTGKFLYQLRVFSVPDGAIPVTPRLEVFRITKDWSVNGGLESVQALNLPEDLAGTAGVMGLVIVDKPTDN